MPKRHPTNSSTKINDVFNDAKAKGQRLKRIRNMANLTREQLCEKSNINIHTLIGWENGRFGGLTHSGATRIIKRVQQEGIHCTGEWLLNNIGSGPSLIMDYANVKADLQKESLPIAFSTEENQLIINELILFRQQNRNATDFIVADNDMSPPYNKGDYVAGIKRYKDKIATVIGLDCIVQLADGRILLRNLRKGPDKNTYNLICNNPHTQSQDAVIYNVKLISAAPVIWHRKKEPL